MSLRPWPLLLAGEEGGQRDVGDLDDLEPDSGDIADGVSLPAETGDQDLIVLLDEVETAVLGHEGGDLLRVLDQLDTDALPDGRVGLLSLNTDLQADMKTQIKPVFTKRYMTLIQALLCVFEKLKLFQKLNEISGQNSTYRMLLRVLF